MKALIFFFILCVNFHIGLAKKDLSEKEFEEEFHELFADKSQEAKASAELAKEEQEIDEENELYDEGLAHFKEEIHEWDDMSSEEFNIEKTGLEDFSVRLLEPGLGLIWSPGNRNTEVQTKKLDTIYSNMDRNTFPEFYDSRALGLVTPVKNQGSCGSCAAFATGAAMEICLMKAGASLQGLDISEQQLIDCGYDNVYAGGCQGARSDAYAKYIVGKEINHEHDYPYMNTEPALTCLNKPYWNPGAKVDEAIVDFECNDDKLMYLVQTFGSAWVAVYASDHGFTNYASGVFDACTFPQHQPNHLVLVVGWGTEQDIPYWLVRNSWGKRFGQDGYIKVKRGTCGINLECGTLSCSSNGRAEPIPMKLGAAFVDTCDVSSIFGKIDGGIYILNFNGKESRVNCIEGVCSAEDTDIPNACQYICGKDECQF